MPHIDSNNALINAITLTEQGSTPSTPDTNKWKIYVNTSGVFKVVDDAGAVSNLAERAGTGAPGDTLRYFQASSATLTAASLGIESFEFASGNVQQNEGGVWVDSVGERDRLYAPAAGIYILTALVSVDDPSQDHAGNYNLQIYNDSDVLQTTLSLQFIDNQYFAGSDPGEGHSVSLIHYFPVDYYAVLIYDNGLASTEVYAVSNVRWMLLRAVEL